jgi:hypothetical protein
LVIDSRRVKASHADKVDVVENKMGSLGFEMGFPEGSSVGVSSDNVG